LFGIITQLVGDKMDNGHRLYAGYINGCIRLIVRSTSLKKAREKLEGFGLVDRVEELQNNNTLKR
jgi:hypothetical protein